MKDRCDALKDSFDGGAGLGEGLESSLREHLGTCALCRAQAAADSALRSAFSRALDHEMVSLDGTLEPEVEGVEARLDHWLAAELAVRASDAERPEANRYRRGVGARWALAAYVTASVAVSVWVLATVSWPAVSPWVPLAALGAVSLLTPLVLFDRLGVVLPPAGG